MQDIHAYLNNDVQTTQILTSSLVAQKATRVQVYRSSGNDAETGFTDEVNAPARLEENGEQPCVISKEYTLSMAEKANLRIAGKYRDWEKILPKMKLKVLI